MSFFQKINRPFILFFALTISIPGWAMPIMFEFTGTVSDSVLISRRYQTIYTTVPEWNGLQVTGRVVMELPELGASPDNRPSHSIYGQRYPEFPYSDWMTFMVTNPDGSLVEVPGSTPATPVPEAEGNDAYTQLSHLSYINGLSSFYATRSYTNSLTYPQKTASISLSAEGDNANWLTSSADFYNVEVNPEFANVDNYGHIYNYSNLGVGHEYTFKIDSLKRVDAKVPEPSLWLLALTGLLLIGWRRAGLHSAGKTTAKRFCRTF